MSDILKELHKELSRAGPVYDVAFLQLPFLSLDERFFLMNVHPHNHRYKLHWTCAFDNKYNFDFEFLRIENDLMTESMESLKKSVVKVVKNFSNNVFCITISPNPTLHQDDEYLHRVVRQLCASCKVVNYYGVFERGCKNDLYHTHVLIEYMKDKNIIQNTKKFFQKTKCT